MRCALQVLNSILPMSVTWSRGSGEFLGKEKNRWKGKEEEGRGVRARRGKERAGEEKGEGEE